MKKNFKRAPFLPAGSLLLKKGSEFNFVKSSLTALLLASPVLSGSVMASEISEPRPNIILIVSDDHHFSALGCMGDVVKTPNIDKLAARGFLFRNNVCQGTVCHSSRNSLITGSYPHQNGVYRHDDNHMPAGIWTFPSALQRAGYTTAMIGKNHFMPALVNPPSTTSSETESDLATSTMALGFDYVHSMAGKVNVAKRSTTPDNDPYRTYLREKGLLTLLEDDYSENRKGFNSYHPSVLNEIDHQDGYIATKVIDYLEGQQDTKPFFLWVNFVEPHFPADAPLPYAEMYDWKQMRPPLQRPDAKMSDEEVELHQKLRAGYYGMISALDAQIGRIVRALEANGQIDNTIIVYTGDQGFMLGDLGIPGKASFYKGSINSPLVIAGTDKLLKGVTVDQPVALIDLVPTFLELGRASKTDMKTFLKRSDGHSLLPLLTGKGNYTRKAAFADNVENDMMVVDEHYKYVKNDQAPMLFDLRNDPNEFVNLAGSLPEVEARMSALISDWLKKTPPIE